MSKNITRQIRRQAWIALYVYSLSSVQLVPTAKKKTADLYSNSQVDTDTDDMIASLKGQGGRKSSNKNSRKSAMEIENLENAMVVSPKGIQPKVRHETRQW
jgi:hypothetical protein